MVISQSHEIRRPPQPKKDVASELPSIFTESWGPTIKLMRGVGAHLEKALDLIPPPTIDKKSQCGTVTCGQLNNAPWAVFLGARQGDEIDLSSIEDGEGKKMITVRFKDRSISATSTDNVVIVSADEGSYSRMIAVLNSPDGKITQLDDIRIKYEKPGSKIMQMNYMHRYNKVGTRTPINQLKENWKLPDSEVGIDSTIYTSLFAQDTK